MGSSVVTHSGESKQGTQGVSLWLTAFGLDGGLDGDRRVALGYLRVILYVVLAENLQYELTVRTNSKILL
ncbi:hypothetical protein MCERH10_02335 [Caulobacteraceae bacterium]